MTPLPLRLTVLTLPLFMADDSPMFLGGAAPRTLSLEETAEVLKVSQETVLRDWKFVESLVLRELSGEKGNG
jgi:hypothetical protein